MHAKGNPLTTKPNTLELKKLLKNKKVFAICEFLVPLPWTFNMSQLLYSSGAGICHQVGLCWCGLLCTAQQNFLPLPIGHDY